MVVGEGGISGRCEDVCGAFGSGVFSCVGW